MVVYFLDNNIAVFDNQYFKDFEDKLFSSSSFKFHIHKMRTRKDILEWYLAMNSGGSIHTNEDLNKVREMLKEC